MLPLFTPLRPVDLANTQLSVLSHAEQILAFSHLSAERILPLPCGLLINQSGAERIWRGPTNGTPCRRHMVTTYELDPFRVTAICNQPIGNLSEAAFIIICPWDNVPPATTYLRVHYLSSEMCFHTALADHVSEACSHLHLPERPANDARLPGYSKSRSGVLIRLDADNTKTFRQYFCLPTTHNLTKPTITELGGNCYLVYATVTNPAEPFRAIMTSHLFLPPAQKDINRWIKAHSHKRPLATEASR